MEKSPSFLNHHYDIWTIKLMVLFFPSAEDIPSVHVQPSASASLEPSKNMLH